MPVRIFGREPVVISNAIEGILAALLAFNMLAFIGLDSAEEIAIVMAVVSSVLGLYVAYVTKDTLLAATLGFVKAAVALIAVYGYNLTDTQLAQVLAAITVVFALWHQRATGPAENPSFNLGQHSGPVVVSTVVPSSTDDTEPLPAETVAVAQVGESTSDQE